MIYQTPCSVVACFSYPDGRTDTMCENNDHLKLSSVKKTNTLQAFWTDIPDSKYCKTNFL